MTVEEFKKQETASRDCIDVKRIYCDIAGDLPAGVMLSQIIFWNLPVKGKKLGDKLRVEREGKRWLAKTRQEWWEECRLKSKQVARCLKVLEEKGIIEKRIFRFNGNPTTHIHFRWETFLKLYNRAEYEVPEVRKSESRFAPKGQNQMAERDISYNIDYKHRTLEASPLGNKESLLNANKTLTSFALSSFDDKSVFVGKEPETPKNPNSLTFDNRDTDNTTSSDIPRGAFVRSEPVYTEQDKPKLPSNYTVPPDIEQLMRGFKATVINKNSGAAG